MSLRSCFPHSPSVFEVLKSECFYVTFQCFLHPGDVEIEIGIFFLTVVQLHAYFHYLSVEILMSQILWL